MPVYNTEAKCLKLRKNKNVESYLGKLHCSCLFFGIKKVLLAWRGQHRMAPQGQQKNLNIFHKIQNSVLVWLPQQLTILEHE